MSFRVRVTLAAGAATLVVVVAVSAAVYVLVRRDLRTQIDQSLGEHLTAGADLSEGPDVPETIDIPHDVQLADQDAAGDKFPFNDRFLQVVDSDGEIVTSYTTSTLPVTEDVLAVARGERSGFSYDQTVDGMPVRVRVTELANGQAFQFGRSLEEVNESLRRLTVTLGAISVAAVGLALVLGRLVAAAAVAPVHRLSEAAETIARTGDLSHHIDTAGRDELARLAGSFNTMLDALEASLDQQRQLVADASHELRTPLASLRTNIEVLQRATDLDEAERSALLEDVVAQIAALTGLVEDVVELARGEDEEPFEPFALDQMVAKVVERARRNHPTIDFALDASPSTVRGAPRRLDRAIANLVDNAAKWSPPGGRVAVETAAGSVSVSDQGPGIDAQDLPRVFDRFYRSTSARSTLGSGLGLAIVKQVADNHGGTVTVGRAPQGGARFVLHLPDDRLHGVAP